MKTAFSFILLFIVYHSIAQTQDVYKFKATLVRVVTKDSVEEFEEVSERKDVSIFVVLNYNKQRLSIYTPTQQDFDLTKVVTSFTDKNNNDWIIWRALDNDAVQCVIREKIFHNETPDGFNTIFYVDYKHSTYEYAGHRES